MQYYSCIVRQANINLTFRMVNRIIVIKHQSDIQKRLSMLVLLTYNMFSLLTAFLLSFTTGRNQGANISAFIPSSITCYPKQRLTNILTVNSVLFSCNRRLQGANFAVSHGNPSPHALQHNQPSPPVTDPHYQLSATIQRSKSSSSHPLVLPSLQICLMTAFSVATLSLRPRCRMDSLLSVGRWCITTFVCPPLLYFVTFNLYSNSDLSQSI